MKNTILILLLVTIVGCWTISEGTRYGEVVKFSEKGIFFKTWEGEMILGGASTNATDQTFEFSLDASSKRGEDIKLLVSQVREAQKSGRRIEVAYIEEMVVAPWRADTTYLIQSIDSKGGSN